MGGAPAAQQRPLRRAGGLFAQGLQPKRRQAGCYCTERARTVLIYSRVAARGGRAAGCRRRAPARFTGVGWGGRGGAPGWAASRLVLGLVIEQELVEELRSQRGGSAT